MKKKRIILKIILLILWFLVIFSFSNQNGQSSTDLTNGLLERILWFVHNDFTFIAIRKIAHITEYLILGILVYNLLIELFNRNIIKYSILICLLCACFDELHQIFVSGREGIIFDVVIDSVGYIIGILLINKYKKNHSK